MRKKIYYALIVVFKILPLKKNVVLFESFGGLYNDNPKYISIKLKELYPNKKIIWVIDDRANKNDIPDYVISVKPMSFSHAYYHSISKNIIDNYAGSFYFFSKKGKFKLFLLKKPLQNNYSTWHGTPLKKIGSACLVNYGMTLYTTSTCFVLNSQYIAEIFKKNFTDKVRSVLIGSPRNDILFERKSDKILKMKAKLGIPDDKYVVLYAPTFREYELSNVTSIYFDKLAIERILNAFKAKFHRDCVFVYRVHQKVTCIDFSFENCINGNVHDDMAEYLLCSDALITDYSGSLFDYTITEKPCFLYMPDYNDYVNERGVYLENDSLPYTTAFSVEELVKNIENFDYDSNHRRIVCFNESIGMCDEGKACENLLYEIFRKNKKNK